MLKSRPLKLWTLFALTAAALFAIFVELLATYAPGVTVVSGTVPISAVHSLDVGVWGRQERAISRLLAVAISMLAAKLVIVSAVQLSGKK